MSKDSMSQYTNNQDLYTTNSRPKSVPINKDNSAAKKKSDAERYNALKNGTLFRGIAVVVKGITVTILYPIYFVIYLVPAKMAPIFSSAFKKVLNSFKVLLMPLYRACGKISARVVKTGKFLIDKVSSFSSKFAHTFKKICNPFVVVVKKVILPVTNWIANKYKVYSGRCINVAKVVFAWSSSIPKYGKERVCEIASDLKQKFSK